MKIYRWLTLMAAIAIAVIEAMMFTSGTAEAPQSGPQFTVVTPGTAEAASLPTDRISTDSRSGAGP
jgi:hypothetical protein